jgi:hypothetical protein
MSYFDSLEVVNMLSVISLPCFWVQVGPTFFQKRQKEKRNYLAYPQFAWD